MTREALKLALEALENAYWPTDSDLYPAHNIKECEQAITAIKEALAQPEPVKIVHKHEWFRTGEMKVGQMRCISCGAWGKEETSQRKSDQESVAVWELFEDGWDSIADQEWMETLPVGTKLYTTPPQRKPLTDEEITVIEDGIWNLGFFDDTERQANREFARAIEAAHGIKGEA